MADRRDILLKEYETCQSHNNGLGNQSWISISILITLNLLVLSQVVSQIVLTSYLGSGLARLLLVILLGLAMVFILGVFWRWQKRIDFQTRLNNDRMKEIEVELGMWKNWRVRGLDLFYDRKREEKKWYRLPRALRRVIFRLSQRYPQKDKKGKQDANYETLYRLPTTEGNFWKGQFKFKWIFPALMIAWGTVMVLQALTYCPPVCHWLLN